MQYILKKSSLTLSDLKKKFNIKNVLGFIKYK